MTKFEISKDISQTRRVLKCMDIVDRIYGLRDATAAAVLADLASGAGMAAALAAG
jgi:hypothetical protein